MEIHLTNDISEYLDYTRNGNMISGIVEAATSLTLEKRRANNPIYDKYIESHFVNTERDSKTPKEYLKLFKEIFYHLSSFTYFDTLEIELKLNLVEALTFLSNKNQVFDKSCFESNKYIKNVNFKTENFEGYSLSYHSLKNGDLFVCGKTFIDENVYFQPLGMFNEDIMFPILKYKDKIIVELSPYEMECMQEPINNATGNVLTYGLGLGYFAYMTSEKEDVKSITIVEKSPEIIELFKRNILPHFSHPEKINIVQENATTHIRKLKDGDFDYCFVDLWGKIYDLNNYFWMKSYEKNFEKTIFEYFDEETMQIRMFRLAMSMFEEIEWNLTHDEENRIYNITRFDIFDLFICHLKNKYENEKICSVEDLEKLTSIEHILS